jgi:hypothetical protein
MGIPEPSGALWGAIKAISDPWPPDNEEAATALGVSWRTTATGVGTAGSGVTAAASEVGTAWPDAAGQTLVGKLGEYVQRIAQAQQGMQAIATRADAYASALTSTKTAITAEVGRWEPVYAMLGNPLFGPIGPAYQLLLAQQVASELMAMVQAAAAQLGQAGGQAVPAAASQASAAAAASGASGPLDELGQGISSLIGKAEGFADRFIGTVVDDLLVGQLAGDGVTETLAGIGHAAGWLLNGAGDLTGIDGLHTAGNAVDSTLTAKGSEWGEDVLDAGMQQRNEAYTAATAADGQTPPVDVYVSRYRYPESAQHIDDAQGGTSYRGDQPYAKTQPTSGTLHNDPAQNQQNRRESLRGIPTKPGYDRDEYPPAMLEEGGAGSSVKYISPSDNRGAGASMGNQVRSLPDGTTVVITTTPKGPLG